MKEFTVHAEYDAEAGVWLGSNADLPLSTEAPTFDQLMTRVLEIAPELAALNGLIGDGEKLTIHFIADRVTA
ncbi:MAG TPA: DUF1902 domain-containing protein [Stellaceae bacterium]|nr:DUF1902 domain-containing protein [Stellaceae bacterium]